MAIGQRSRLLAIECSIKHEGSLSRDVHITLRCIAQELSLLKLVHLTAIRRIFNSDQRKSGCKLMTVKTQRLKYGSDLSSIVKGYWNTACVLVILYKSTDRSRICLFFYFLVVSIPLSSQRILHRSLLKAPT